MTISLTQNPSANEPLMIAASRLAKDVTPDRTAQMLDAMGVQDSSSVVEAATQIVTEARNDFDRAWYAAARKATTLMITGLLLIVAGVALLVSSESGQTASQLVVLVGGLLTFRALKRREQLARQAFRTTVRFN